MRWKLSLAESLAVLKDFGMPYELCARVTYKPTHKYVTQYSSTRSQDWFRAKRLTRPSWNGETLAITEDKTSDGIIHELGHWLTVPTALHKKRDFGLGMGFDSEVGSKRIVSDDVAELAENEACAFEISCFYFWGLKWRSIAAGVGFHPSDSISWDHYVDNEPDMRRAVIELRTKEVFGRYNHAKNLPTRPELQYWAAKIQKQIDAFTWYI